MTVVVSQVFTRYTATYPSVTPADTTVTPPTPVEYESNGNRVHDDCVDVSLGPILYGKPPLQLVDAASAGIWEAVFDYVYSANANDFDPEDEEVSKEIIDEAVAEPTSSEWFPITTYNKCDHCKRLQVISPEEGENILAVVQIPGHCLRVVYVDHWYSTHAKVESLCCRNTLSRDVTEFYQERAAE